jgi:hypothetical protein
MTPDELVERVLRKLECDAWRERMERDIEAREIVDFVAEQHGWRFIGGRYTYVGSEDE